MHSWWRIIGITLIFGGTSIAWVVLGGVTTTRSSMQTYTLRGEVSSLWGRPHVQAAPTLTLLWTTEEDEAHTETSNGNVKYVTQRVKRRFEKAQNPKSTRIEANLGLDQRLKGLVWYSLYNIDFAGRWTYVHDDPKAGAIRIDFAFPDAAGIYDRFRFVIDGQDRTAELDPAAGQVVADVPVQPGQEVVLEIGYASRGMDEWRYVPAQGVSRLEDFELTMTTDFAEIDFPRESMSPSERRSTGTGWALVWRFSQVVTGHGIGMVMPDRIQPGELASELAFSAPVSLLFFFLVIFVLDVVRKIGMHPINYLFLAGGMFAFHLLFAYSVDHLDVVTAFALSSIVSLLLVASYLRLVVSNRFAFVEATFAQVVYLVGFSLAHFWEGFTGLTVTVLAIVTLFLLMQWTGRVRWPDALASKPVSDYGAL